MNKAIPLIDLKRQYNFMKEQINQALEQCLEEQNWILGSSVSRLEEEIAQYEGVPYSVGVASGTDALVIALRALAIKCKNAEYFTKEDKIITTAFTFTATGDAILRAGATPVFIDIDPTTFNIDTDKLRAYLSKKNDSGVVGIVPVHLFGQACNMGEIMSLAQEFHLFVVEDAAQAFGGYMKQKKLGAWGHVSALSFFPSKNLGSFGDAGMVITYDPTIAEITRMLTKHGGKDKYNVDHIGYNSRLDTIQAAILLVRLQYVNQFITKRRHVANLYDKHLKGVKGLQLPLALPEAYHAYNQYTIRVFNGKRDILQKNLKARSIGTAIYYPLPLYKMRVFKDKSIVPFTLVHTDRSCDEVLSLPIDPLLEDSEVLLVSQVIQEIMA